MTIVNEHGYIVHPKVRAAYDRICDSNGRLAGVRSAEAFLRLILRHTHLAETLP